MKSIFLKCLCHIFLITFLAAFFPTSEIAHAETETRLTSVTNAVAAEAPEFYTYGDILEDTNEVLYGHVAVMVPVAALIIGRAVVADRLETTSALRAPGDLLGPSELRTYLAADSHQRAMLRGQSSAWGVNELNMEVRSADHRRIAQALASTRNSSLEELERVYRNLVDEAWRAHAQGQAAAPTEVRFRLQNSNRFAAGLRFLEERYTGRTLLFSPGLITAIAGVRLSHPENITRLIDRHDEVYCVILPEGAENTSREATCMPRSVLGQIFNGARYYQGDRNVQAPR